MKTIDINYIDYKSITKEYACIFIDANVWLLQLKKQIYTTTRYEPNHEDKKFQKTTDFIEKILELNITNQPAPKIAITSLLLSELSNRYLRDIAMYNFFKNKFEKEELEKRQSEKQNFKEYYQKKNFKKDYQKKEEDCEKQLIIFLEFFTQNESCFELFDDNFSALGVSNIIKGIQENNIDFNDYYFYCIAKKHKLPIVTNDGDFNKFLDIDIITQNQDVLITRKIFEPSKNKKHK